MPALKHPALLLPFGVLLAGCVPGPVTRSPAVVGTVYDHRTHQALAGTRVSVAVPGEGSSAAPLPDTVTDARGHFLLEARYKFGLALVHGNPGPTPVTVRFSKEGYGDVVVHTSYNLHDAPEGALHADATLEPDPIKKNTHP